MSSIRLTALFLFASTLAAQTTVTVPCDLDNTLYQDLSGSVSNGVGQNVFVGENGVGLARRAVLRFDVAGSVPAGAAIVAASLQMNVNLCTDIALLTVDGHRLTSSWGEGPSTPSGVGGGGGGGGGPSKTNDATWIHRLYPGTLWTTPGGDFAALPSFTFAMPLNGAFTVPAAPGLVADVQAWRDNPATNLGWVLKAQTENTAQTARRLASRQSSTVANRPTLSVTYLLQSQTATWGTGCPSPLGTYSFAFTGAMIAGNTVGLSHTGGPANGIGANYFAVELNQPGALLYPSCSVYLPLSGNWIFWTAFLFDNAGVSSTPFTVPSGYPGLFFMSQSIGLEATAPLGLTLSNAGIAVIQ